MSHQISTTGQILTDAHTNGEFDDIGTACSALAILARKMVQCDSFTSIGATVGALEREVVDSGAAGDLCFEAGLGLGIIAQAMAESEAASKRNDLVEMVRRIAAVLVGELGKCFVVECRCLRGVVDGVRAGRASEGLLRLCGREESGDFVVQDGCRRAIVSLYIALSLVMPAVLSIDGDILRALTILLRKMPWGNGKGYALASAHRVGKIAKLTTEHDASHLLDHCTQIVKECHGGAEHDDVLLVLAELSNDDNDDNDDNDGADTSIATRCREILEHENGPNVSPTVRATSATAATKSLGSLPMLFGGDGDFFGGSRLRVGVSKKEVARMVGVLATVADDVEEDTRVRDAAAMNIGILASMRYAVARRRGGDTAGAEGARGTTTRPASSMRDTVPDRGGTLPPIPRASEGTLTALIADAIHRTLRNTPSVRGAA